MLLPRRWRIPMFVLVALCMVPALSAVVFEFRDWHGKQISCSHGGAWGSESKACGTEGFEMVFIGTVESVIEVSDTDRQLKIIPGEIFLGHHVGSVTTTVNQACLTPNEPEIKAGDKWLFYLTTGSGMSFDGPSKPLSQAQEDIVTLRHLAGLTDSGMVDGNILKSGFEGLVGVPKHKIVAKRVSDGAEYSTLSDNHGDFQFGSLPLGSYEVTANTVDGLWADPERVGVRQAACAQTSFLLATDGGISGHMGSADGKPFTVHPWVEIVSVDNTSSYSAYVDANGYFAARGVEPGRYVVGLGIQPGAPIVPTPIYYPGVPTKKQATVIELGRTEKRTHIDLT